MLREVVYNNNDFRLETVGTSSMTSQCLSCVLCCGARSEFSMAMIVERTLGDISNSKTDKTDKPVNDGNSTFIIIINYIYMS